MNEPALIITNNKMVQDNLSQSYEVIFISEDLIGVLRSVRDCIHKGHKLLTHPLSGSVKPNETPYKTVLISKINGETIDIDSLNLIENSIQTAEKFIKMKETPKWPEKLLNDFRLIDYDLIYHAIR